MEPEALYAAFAQLIAEAPDLDVHGEPFRLAPEHYRWIGRLTALLESMGQQADAFAVQQAVPGLGTSLHRRSVSTIMSKLHAGFARAEVRAPLALQGGFIPAGDRFGGLAAVAQLLREATRSVFIVDPYLDESLLTDFAVMMQPKRELRVLGDSSGIRPGLLPALTRWREQYPDRPVSIRKAPERSLHDRAIFIDEAVAYTVGQSLKDLAARAHCLIQRVDPERMREKLQAYSSMFDAGVEVE